jgi:hypothetical protein
MMRLALQLTLVLLGAAVCVAGTFYLPTAHVSGNRHGRATQGMDCSVCHTTAGWQVNANLKNGARFDHDRTGFPLRGGHSRAACSDCHDGRVQLSRACSDCHKDAHGGKLGRSCDRCHDANSFQSGDAFALHSRTRFPLTGMHALVDCADCHKRRSSDGFSSVPSQCFACHERDYRRPDVHPVHDGSQGALAFPRNCAECHRTDAFVPAVVDAGRFSSANLTASPLATREHDKSFVLSYGPHRNAPCASCHVTMNQPRAVRCASCHSTATLLAQHPRLGAPAEGSCLACHPGGVGR